MRTGLVNNRGKKCEDWGIFLYATFFEAGSLEERSSSFSLENEEQSSGGVLLSRDYPSIMGAEELDDRVRDGNGYDLLAITTRINVQRVVR